MTYVVTIQMMVTKKPLQTGMYVMSHPRSMMPRRASHANVCGKQYAMYLSDERENFFFVISTERGALSLYHSTDRSAVGMDSTGHMMPLRIMFG